MTRDDLLRDLSRAVRECFPDRAEMILGEVGRWMVSACRWHLSREYGPPCERPRSIHSDVGFCDAHVEEERNAEEERRRCQECGFSWAWTGPHPGYAHEKRCSGYAGEYSR